MKISLNEHKLNFTYTTPDLHAGYYGIAKKTVENTAVAIATLVGLPLLCTISSLSMVALSTVIAFKAAAIGTAQSIATPIIAVKDLTHHTYRVVFSKA